MKVLIAGSRTMSDDPRVYAFIEKYFDIISEVVSGGAKGVDKLGERWATAYHIPITRFIPDWNLSGRSAGMIRNKQMAEYADALIAIWDGKSKGTKNMIEPASDQLSGLGFNATVADELVVKLQGTHKRMLKLRF